MKTNLMPSARRGAYFSGLVLASLLLYNCSSKDLETIDPYEFENEEFEEVEFVPVADPEPEFEAPETGEVAASEETLGIIADIMGAATAGEIDPATEEALATVDAFAEELPAEVLTVAENLTATDVAAILDPNTELDPALVDVASLLDQVSEELQQLLPEIVLTTTSTEAAAQSFNKQMIMISGQESEVVAQALFGACVEAANEAYDATIAELETARDSNIITIEENYQRRLTEAEARYQTRLETFVTDFQANQDAIEATITELLAAADKAESLGDVEMAEDIRILALLYAVDGRVKLAEWEVAVNQLLVDTRAAEEAEVLAIRTDLSAEANANYNSAEAEADVLLSAALANCHNQGAGN